MKAVILADGVFPSHPIPLQTLHEASTIYCCDGAIHKLLRHQAHTTHDIHVVGDGDSLHRDSLRDLGIAFHCVQEQDYNDLTKTVRYALHRGEKQLTILGATGLREDHTLGNFSLLSYYLAEFGLPIPMLTDHGLFTPINRTTTFPSFPRQQVSLFSLCNATLITTHGLVYPLLRAPLTQWWMGTLNEALGHSFTIETEGPAELIIYQTHEPKA